MRQLTFIEIDRIKLLTENAIELCLIEPTETGLIKSIMDATGSVRNFLKSKNIHDFRLQNQGQESKVQIVSKLIEVDKFVDSIASLYRPNTKNGDPRIWFKGLGNYSKANDILGIIEFEGILYVLNITQIDLYKLLNSKILNPLQELVNEINHISNEVADELLFKLKELASRGFIPALLQADTSIGRTLEHLLDIKMNSSKTPDYKGIELKSARENKGTRKGLFGKTPNWELSKFKSRIEILDTFGYWESGIFRLYNTIRGTGRNAQGLILRTDYELDYLFENSDRKEIGDFLVWELQVLKDALAIKHKETFWIKAESKFEDNKEYFLFKSAEHTRKPLLNQFGLLIDIGAITLDYPIKRLPDGSVIDKGCNFKLKPNALSLLFPPSQSYSLITK
ncbi:MAG: MvaI/BcnI family restriction endonuclease [Flavobacteriaceae bacterium]|nr:MvaI/BcnI family restriction endonuclease [Flavobacteriaceae bacterium]